MFNWFWKFLYNLAKSLLRCIDFILDFSQQLAGIKPVSVPGVGKVVITDYFLTSTPIFDAFKKVAIIGLILLFFFTAFAVLRSVGKMGLERSAVGASLDGAKTILYFLMVPIIMIVGNMVVTTVMTALYEATKVAQGSTLGSSLFMIYTDAAYDGDASLKDSVMAKFLSGEYSYKDTNLVNEYFDLSEIDYFLAYVSGVAVLFMLVKPMMTFVERTISLCILFVIAPVSVSTAPIDGGHRFKLWREQVINKFLLAYGSLLTLNIFTLILTTINNIVFFENNSLNYLARLMFVLGGAFACKQGTILIGNLVNSGAGSQQEQDSRGMNMALGGLVGGALHAAGGALNKTVGKAASLPINSAKKNLSAAIHRKGDAKRAVRAEAEKNKYSQKMQREYSKHQADRSRSQRSKDNDWRGNISLGQPTVAATYAGGIQSILEGKGSGGTDPAQSPVNTSSKQSIVDAMHASSGDGDKK